MDREFIITEYLLRQIGNYLVKQPFDDVELMVAGLRLAKPLEQTPNE